MWPTSGPGGYITPAAWGVPSASQRGAESKAAAVRSGSSQKWKILFFGEATLQSVDFTVGGQYHKYPTSAPSGC